MEEERKGKERWVGVCPRRARVGFCFFHLSIESVSLLCFALFLLWAAATLNGAPKITLNTYAILSRRLLVLPPLLLHDHNYCYTNHCSSTPLFPGPQRGKEGSKGRLETTNQINWPPQPPPLPPPQPGPRPRPWPRRPAPMAAVKRIMQHQDLSRDMTDVTSTPHDQTPFTHTQLTSSASLSGSASASSTAAAAMDSFPSAPSPSPSSPSSFCCCCFPLLYFCDFFASL